MRNAGGCLIVTTDAGVVEHDTYTCFHCNSIVVVTPKCPPEQLGGFCRRCMKMICSRCEAAGRCVPFERRLEQMESRDRLLRQVGSNAN